MCNALVIFPFHADLKLLPVEAQTVINELRPRKVLQGTVTEADVLEALDDLAPLDGIWIGSHVSTYGVQFSDGVTAHSVLAVAFAAADVSWLVINGCDSEGGAAHYTRAGMDVIGVAQSAEAAGIEDRDAARMARLLAKALSDGSDLAEAYEQVRNADPRYLYFPQSSVKRNGGTSSALVGDIQELKLEVKIIRMELERIKHEISEDSKKIQGDRLIVAIWIAIGLMSALFVAILWLGLTILRSGGL